MQRTCEWSDDPRDPSHPVCGETRNEDVPIASTGGRMSNCFLHEVLALDSGNLPPRGRGVHIPTLLVLTPSTTGGVAEFFPKNTTPSRMGPTRPMRHSA